VAHIAAGGDIAVALAVVGSGAGPEEIAFVVAVTLALPIVVSASNVRRDCRAVKLFSVTLPSALPVGNAV